MISSAEKVPATEHEIDAFLAAFETGTLAKAQWTHAAHLLTGACYVHAFGEQQAIGHMRLCVRRFNVAVGGQNTETSGYHETITVFWIKVLASLHTANASLSRAEFAVLAVERYRDRRDLFRQYYDFDLVASTEARRIWMEPTLKEIFAAKPN